MSFPIDRIRSDFPILSQKIHDKDLVYLDNAATTLKPQPVVDALIQHYQWGASNVHRGVHFLSEQATRHFEDARESIRQFIGARSPSEILFTSGTTLAFNSLALSLSRMLDRGDEILISEMEHHSNIVPWQLVAKEKGLIIKKIPLLASGDLDLEAYYKLLSPRCKLVSATHVSNALGTMNPLEKMIPAAHEVGARFAVDGAQSVGHLPIDVTQLDCDFFAFSGHKLFGPTGIGVLYGKKALLEELPPAIGGGGMIRRVSFDGTTFAPPPEKFEAGTPHIAGAIGLAKAVTYLQDIGMAKIAAYENELTSYGAKILSQLKGVRIVGSPSAHTSIFSFVIDGIHPHDVGSLLDQEGVAIRSGHHCCQPIMDFYKLPATSRASLSFYNVPEDIDRLADAIKKAQEIFA